MTNLSSFPAFIYRPTIEIKSMDSPRGIACYFEGDTNQWNRFHLMLAAGEGRNFAIPAPPRTLSPWRLSVFAYSDFGMTQKLRRLLHGRWMPFELTSDWFGDSQ
jgi:hypothetical protein